VHAADRVTNATQPNPIQPNAVGVQVDNTLRWRYAVDDQGNYVVGDDGEYVKESNAKIVKWSDGSETLVLGDTHIGVCSAPLAR
jgi:RNA polymerase-associated protein LEO1